MENFTKDELKNFIIGVISGNFFYVANVAKIHTDNIIATLIIGGGKLPCRAVFKRDIVLFKLLTSAVRNGRTFDHVTTGRFDGDFVG